MEGVNKNNAEVDNTTSAMKESNTFPALKKEFYEAEKNKDIKKMAKIYHELLKIGFGETNLYDEFRFS